MFLFGLQTLTCLHGFGYTGGHKIFLFKKGLAFCPEMGQILRPKTEHLKSEQFDNRTIMVCPKSKRVQILDVDCT